MKKYDSYKDSGIEWIGEIPSHWDVKRLKNIGSLYSGLSGKSGSDFEKVPTENFKPFINFTNIANNKYIVGDNFGFVKIDGNENQNQVKKNDLFFLMSSENQEDVGKSALLLNDYDELYLNSFCKGFRLTINSDARFVNYLLTSSALSQLISLEGRGFTRINLRMEGVENLPIILPQSIEEQATIANYLDHKTSQIDHLIAKKEQFIQLLEEERVAVINQAVTKGLDPNVPMKDSGIDWLGEIPEHWEVKQVRYLLEEGKEGIKIGPFGSSLKLDFMTDKGYKVYGQENVIKNDFNKGAKYIDESKYKEMVNYTISSGDIVITMMGTAGLAKVVPNDFEPGIMDSHLTRIRVNKSKFSNRLFELLINDSYLIKSQVKFLSKGSIMGGLNSSIIKSFILPTPDIDEQVKILAFIEKSILYNQEIMNKTQQEIELLKEYKTALISEVVTGKVDVSTSSTQVLEMKN